MRETRRMVEMMGCFRAWLAAVSFASFLGSRIEQLVKWNHCFVGSVGRVGFLGAPNLLNPQMSLSVSMPWSVGLMGSLWLWQPTPVLEAARGQLNRPVYSPGMQVCCAVTDTRLHSAWQTVFFTALRSYSGSAETPLCRFDVFLSQVLLFLTTLSAAEEMWHHLLFVLFRAIPSWAAGESRPIAAGPASLEQKMEICQTSVTSERRETLLIEEKTLQRA